MAKPWRRGLSEPCFREASQTQDRLLDGRLRRRPRHDGEEKPYNLVIADQRGQTSHEADHPHAEAVPRHPQRSIQWVGSAPAILSPHVYAPVDDGPEAGGEFPALGIRTPKPFLDEASNCALGVLVPARQIIR
jgi:hypothetical protein